MNELTKSIQILLEVIVKTSLLCISSFYSTIHIKDDDSKKVSKVRGVEYNKRFYYRLSHACYFGAQEVFNLILKWNYNNYCTYTVYYNIREDNWRP